MSTTQGEDDDFEVRARSLVQEIAELVLRRQADKDIDATVVARLMTPGVGYLYDLGDQDLAQLMTVIRGVRGRAKQVDELRRYFEQLRKRARAAAGSVDDTGGPLVRDAVEAPNEWPAYPTPAGWSASPTGISKLVPVDGELREVLVADEPLFVTAIRHDAGTGRESVVVGYRRHSRWVEIGMPREHARNGRDLVAYGGQGLPVSAGSSRDLEAWLVGCERSGRGSIPVRQVTTRTGWHGDSYIQGPGGAIELDDPNGTKAGWIASGTWDGWCDAMVIAESEPAVWIGLYAGVTSMLLRWLGLGHCPIVDLSGPRGRGKTTVIRTVGSGWGRPDDGDGGTVLTWDASATNVERLASRNWDAPLLLDDTKRALRPQDVTRALYALAQGRGRGRGTVADVQRTATWRTVTISTGEAPLVEATEAGGARVRVLSITITPAIASLSMAKRIEAGITAHHGHLAPRVAARALVLGPELRVRYQAALGRWAAVVPADTRLLSTCAALEVAHSVCQEVGVPEPQCDWHAAIEEALRWSVVAADQATRALALVREDLARFPEAYQAVLDDRAPQGGWRGMNRPLVPWVGVYQGVLTNLLADAGHDLAPVVSQWVERGVLVTNKGNLYRTRIDGQLTVPMYAFKKSEIWPADD